MQFRVSVFAICLIGISLVQCSRVLAHFGRRVVPSSGPVLPTEPLLAKVCMLIGFRSKSGLYLRDAVFGDNNVPKDTVLFQANTLNELVSASALGDVAIVHVSALERNTDAAPLLESISVYVQGLCKKKRASSSLIVLVDGREDEGRVLEKIVDEIAAEAQTFDCSLEVIYRYSGGEGAFDVEQVEAVRDTVLSRAIESASKRKKPHSVAEIQKILRSVRESSALAPPKRPLSAESGVQQQKECAAVEAVMHLPQEFQGRLRSSLASAARVAAGKPANTTLRAFTAAVRQVATQFRLDHTALLQAHLDTQAVRRLLPAQCREGATELLLPLYGDVVRAMRRDLVRRFDKAVERLLAEKNSPYLPDLLRALSESTLAVFSSDLQRVHVSFAKMALSSESAVEAPALSPPASALSAKPSTSKDLPRLPQFDGTFEKYQLSMYIQQACTECVREQSLAGAYNPYVRNYPFPPFHLNFNYLLDPKGLFANKEFARMYDDPRFGPCENRADPLVFDGVAMVPFSPNDLPLPPDPRGTWQKIKDAWSGKDAFSVGAK